MKKDLWCFSFCIDTYDLNVVWSCLKRGNLVWNAAFMCAVDTSFYLLEIPLLTYYECLLVFQGAT